MVSLVLYKLTLYISQNNLDLESIVKAIRLMDLRIRFDMLCIMFVHYVSTSTATVTTKSVAGAVKENN